MATARSREHPHRANVLVLADRVPRPGLRTGDHRLLQLLTELVAVDPTPRVALVVADWCAGVEAGDIVSRLGVGVVSHTPDWPTWFGAQRVDLVVIHGPLASRRFGPILDGTHPGVPRVVDAVAIESLDGAAPLAPLRNDDRGRAVTLAAAREHDRRLLEGASVVLCASEHEAALIREVAPESSVAVLRTYASTPATPLPRSLRRDIAFLGTFVEGVCSPDEDAVDFLVHDVLPLVRRSTDITLHVVGEDANPSVRLPGDGACYHVARGSVVPFLSNVRAVVAVRRFGRGLIAAPFAGCEAGTPIIASATVADAHGLPRAMHIGDGAQALAEAILACAGDDAAWETHRQVMSEWAAGLGHDQYQDALQAVLAGCGLVGLRFGRPSVAIEWRGRTHGRWAADPKATSAPSVPCLDLTLAEQVTTRGVQQPETLLVFPIDAHYHEWIRQRDPSPRQRWANEARASALPYRPLFSVIVNATAPELLAATVASLRAQVYERWEVCVADSSSMDPEVLTAMSALAGSDRRVRLVPVDPGVGEAAAANAALARARGEYVAFVPAGGHLEPLALLEVADLLNQCPELDIVYTDEHEYDRASGQRLNPSLKPSWSPDLLRSTNYLGQLTLVRNTLVGELGGLRTGYEGALDYDLALRATAASDHIGQVAQPLYRSDAGRPIDTAVVDAGRRALADAVARSGREAVVEDIDRSGAYRVRYAIVDQPFVGITIPTRDRVDLLERAIRSVRDRSTYRNIEITIIDNASRDPATLEYLERHDGPVLRYDAPFNYARMMNLAIAHSTADLLLLLNNDIEVHQPDWIEAMLEHAQRAAVGAVGVRLWYPSGSPQHQGIFVGGHGRAVHADFARSFFVGDDRHFLAGIGRSVANFSAVTAACLMARASVLAEVGGFDERLHVVFNDVDLCLRLRARGYDIVCTPFASVVHEESATRGSEHPKANDEWFRRRWRADEDHEDPFSNPNYDQHRRFSLKPTWE